MFTGIIESLGKIERIEKEGTNIHFTVSSTISDELKIDQSIAHDGVCLTVIAREEGMHTVTAIDETMNRTRLAQWQVGTMINLERAMRPNARLDGHMVQGHVDTVGECISIEDVDGSWNFRFRFQPTPEHMLVDKGSVCINGISLTVVSPVEDTFGVSIIPYTFEETNFHQLSIGQQVNLEFDIIGKYIAKHLAVYGGVGK